MSKKRKWSSRLIPKEPQQVIEEGFFTGKPRRVSNAAMLTALTMTEAEARRYTGFDRGTYRGSDLGQHRQGYCRAGAWATRTSGDMLDYGQSYAWLGDYDDGVYVDDRDGEAEAGPLATLFVEGECDFPDAIEEGDLIGLRGVEYDRKHDRLARRAGRRLTDGLESYHTYQVHDPEEWTMAVEEASGRPLATPKPSQKKARPMQRMDVQHGFRQTRVTVTDTAALEGNILRLNGEKDPVYEEAVKKLAWADMLAFFRFVEQLDKLEKSGYNAARVRKAIAEVVSKLARNPDDDLSLEEKFFLQQRMGLKHNLVTRALDSLKPAL